MDGAGDEAPGIKKGEKEGRKGIPGKAREIRKAGYKELDVSSDFCGLKDPSSRNRTATLPQRWIEPFYFNILPDTGLNKNLVARDKAIKYGIRFDSNYPGTLHNASGKPMDVSRITAI